MAGGARQVYRTPSFLEFIRGGTAINVVVAIDFTLSNGALALTASFSQPRHARSRHTHVPVTAQMRDSTQRSLAGPCWTLNT